MSKKTSLKVKNEVRKKVERILEEMKWLTELKGIIRREQNEKKVAVCKSG